MLVSKVKNKLPKNFYESLEFKKFRPSQEKAINAGLLDGKNMLVNILLAICRGKWR